MAPQNGYMNYLCPSKRQWEGKIIVNSKILLGNDNEESAKNVVRFETNLKWSELLDVLPVANKAPRYWKITDFNNLMNENPQF